MSTPLTAAQAQALRIVPRLIAIFSFLGSGSILYSITSCRFCYKRQEWVNASVNAVVGRSLLFGMCVADLLSSCSYIIGDVAWPVDAGGGNGKGNQGTCNFQGFLCNLQVAAALYSGFLAWYYCLYIRYRWRRRRLRQMETIAHITSWAFVLVTGVTSIVEQLYHPHWIRCYISGPGTNGYFWGFFYAPIWTSMLCGSVAMLLIFLEVKNTETRSLRHTFQSVRMTVVANIGSGDRVGLGDEPSDSFMDVRDPMGADTRNNPRSPLSRLPRSRRVAYQGLCYTAGFILIYIFPTTSRIWQTVCCSPPYAIQLLATSFVTSQGLFNWLVYYAQPRLLNYWLQRQQEAQQENPMRRLSPSTIAEEDQLEKDPQVLQQLGPEQAVPKEPSSEPNLNDGDQAGTQPPQHASETLHESESQEQEPSSELNLNNGPEARTTIATTATTSSTPESTTTRTTAVP